MTEKQILWLQVTVDDTCSAVEILNGIEHLSEVITSVIFREASSLVFEFYEREEVALLDQLKDNEKDLDCPARAIDNEFTVAVPVNEVDDVGVTDVLQQLYFVVKNLLKSWQRQPFHVVSLYNFYGQELPSLDVLC